jgi:hypothetical protein
VSGLRSGGLTSGAWRLGLSADHYRLGTTLRGADEVPPTTDREAYFTRVALNGTVGLPARARLVAEVPFEDRRRRIAFTGPSGAEVLPLDGRALGDVTTTALIEVWPRAARPRPWALEVGAGVKWATGATDLEDEGLGLPAELQPGTGSTDPLFVATLRHVGSSTGVVATALYRVTQANDDGYRFGREGDVTLAGWYAPGATTSLGLDLRYRDAGRDEFLGRPLRNSGGTRLLAGPRAGVVLTGARLGLEAAVLWPIRQELNGTQLGVDSEWTLGVSWPAP